MSIGTIYGYLDFPVLLLIGTSLIARYFPRRKYWYITLPLGCLILIGNYIFTRTFDFASAGFNTFVAYMSSPMVYLLCILTMVISFRATMASILFAATVGYCLQNFSYCLMSIIRISIGLNETEQWYCLMGMLIPIFSLTYFALHMVYLRKPEYRYRIDRIHERRQIVVSVISILGISVISVFSMKTASELASNSVWYITYFFNMTVCSISITSEFELLRSRRNAIENTRIKTLWENDKRNYQKSQENMQLVNVRMHDLRHRIDSLSSRLSPNEVQDLKSSMQLYATISETGCEVLDMVLSEKYPYLIQENIRFTCLFKGEKLNYLPKESLYSVFENALSNAMEAVLKLPMEKRVISLTGKEYGEYINVEIENFCDMENTNTQIGKTTKKDSSLHGYGLLSMKMMMEKHQGRLGISKSKDVFTLSLFFPTQDAYQL